MQNIHATTWNQVSEYESKSFQDLHKPLGQQLIEFDKIYLFSLEFLKMTVSAVNFQMGMFIICDTANIVIRYLIN